MVNQAAERYSARLACLSFNLFLLNLLNASVFVIKKFVLSVRKRGGNISFWKAIYLRLSVGANKKRFVNALLNASECRWAKF